MSRFRLIPKLQLALSSIFPNRLVLTVSKNFSDLREIGDAVSQSKIFQDQKADELIFVDISREKKNIDLLARVIANVSEEIFMPLTAGGGVMNLDDFRLLLNNGADKISVNSGALKDPSLIKRASEKFGSQCVVLSVDYRIIDHVPMVFINNGTTSTGRNVFDWVVEAEDLGAGEVLLTSIDNDGTKNGLDIETLKAVTDLVSIPVIGSGGCGLAAHFIEGFSTGSANAIAAGSFFAQRDQNFMQTRSHIANAGINIRR